MLCHFDRALCGRDILLLEDEAKDLTYDEQVDLVGRAADFVFKGLEEGWGGLSCRTGRGWPFWLCPESPQQTVKYPRSFFGLFMEPLTKSGGYVSALRKGGVLSSLGVATPTASDSPQPRADCEDWQQRREEEKGEVYWQPLTPSGHDWSVWYYPSAPRLL